MEKVSFYSGPGLKLSAILELPSDYARGMKFPGVVMCQGPGGSKGFVTPGAAGFFNKAGYATLRFDYRGFGESEGPRNRLIPLEQVEDIRSAITFLQQRPEIDACRMGLWGAATGGANVSYTSAVDARVKCMVGVNSMGDGGRWMRIIRRYWEWMELLKVIEEDRKERVLTGKSRLVASSDVILQERATQHLGQPAQPGAAAEPPPGTGKSMLSLESVGALISYRPVTVVSRIAPRAAMWIVAAGDTLVPNELSESMYDCACEPKRLVCLEGEEHHGLYSGHGLEKVMGHSIEWFDRYLKK